MSSDVSTWFDDYLAVFGACGRGERRASDMLPFYAAPVLLTADGTVARLEDGDQIGAWVQSQVDAMIASDYARSDVLELAVSSINSHTALVRGRFSRRSRDDREIQRLYVTYLIVGPDGERQICALMLHSA